MTSFTMSCRAKELCCVRRIVLLATMTLFLCGLGCVGGGGLTAGISANTPATIQQAPLRAMQVDLDYVYDADPIQEEKNLRLLLTRVKKVGVNTVFLQAYADPDGNDGAEALYFPSQYLPMRRDLFARTAAAIRKMGIRVYAWMPLLAFAPAAAHTDLLVQRLPLSRDGIAGAGRAHRLSPFHPRARRLIRAIYRELAEHAVFDGILFHDDSVLSDFEDVSPAAMTVYRQAGFPDNINTIRASVDLRRRWSRFKTRYVIDFSLSLVAMLRTRYPALRSARAIYGRAVFEPESEEWLCQSLPLFLHAYDYSVVLAMPYLEKAPDPDNWLAELADRALAQALRPEMVVFELQSMNWWRKKKIPSRIMVHQFALLERHGVVSFAYYPDDFFHDHPNASLLNQVMTKGTRLIEGGRLQ